MQHSIDNPPNYKEPKLEALTNVSESIPWMNKGPVDYLGLINPEDSFSFSIFISGIWSLTNQPSGFSRIIQKPTQETADQWQIDNFRPLSSWCKTTIHLEDRKYLVPGIESKHRRANL